ncbi:helicase-associated domain-containing protein [Streptomyces sp. H39-S7]|uniref:helicase-associated domain-containing protein n=1 Tax=Streptomyces sp. H39-S7 TaxID=3004357 RepID=UPI0022AF43F9|nr:helicase-associated domain-containing protein [Streptomyces sp. H39-S7]MCZ4122722.1 helicase-associated domain-containing protein [Streptomyces sp. H39-S7]
MNSASHLKKWLAGRTRDQLTALLDSRSLPEAARYSGPVDTWGRLADHLLTDASVGRALASVTTGDLRLLAAVAQLADATHGPAPAGPPPSRSYQPAHAPAFDPADRAVPRAEVLRQLAPDAAGVAAVEEALERLAAWALVLPPHPRTVVVPALLHRGSAEFQGYGRPAEELLSAAFNAPEVHALADRLGVGRAPTRDQSQRLIIAFLRDPARVQALAAQAPPPARRLLARLVPGPPLLRTRYFVSRSGTYAGPYDKFTERLGGSGDPGSDWLAHHGLLLPVDTDLAELPYEVAHALRENTAAGIVLTPPGVTCTAPLPRGAQGQAQAAAASAAGSADLILRAVAAQPLAVRKAGGLAVRETRRVAKDAGLSEDQARWWIDLAATADLLGPHQEQPAAPSGARRSRSRRLAPDAPVRLLPTPRYNTWSGLSPARRLLPLVATWGVVPEVFTYWPADTDQSPVAFLAPTDPRAAVLRHGLLDALAALPADRGLVDSADAWDEVLACAVWFRPSLTPFLGTADLLGRAQATLAEADRLGVTAHGALTAVGRALHRLLHEGAARHFPAIPGAGMDLTDRPPLAEAVQALCQTLDTVLPAPRTTARFQADLTATVTGAATADLTDLLSTCAERESDGHATVWRLTAASLRRAFDTGLSADTLLARLTEVSEDGTALPQPLTYTIKDIARAHGRLRVVRSACCIRCDDPQLIIEVAAARGLAKLGLRVIAPTVLISTAPPQDTLTALRAAGYTPTLEAESGTTVLERAPQERAHPRSPDGAPAHPHDGPGPATAPALAAALLRRPDGDRGESPMLNPEFPELPEPETSRKRGHSRIPRV